MSMPLQQSPPTDIYQQSFTSHRKNGSIGPVIAVLAVITILGIVAGMIGRLCSGRRIMGYGQFDFEGWVERKCSSCIDGRVETTANTASVAATGDSVPVAIPVEIPQETKQPEQSTQNPPTTVES